MRTLCSGWIRPLSLVERGTTKSTGGCDGIFTSLGHSQDDVVVEGVAFEHQPTVLVRASSHCTWRMEEQEWVTGELFERGRHDVPSARKAYMRMSYAPFGLRPCARSHSSANAKRAQQWSFSR